MAAKSAKDVVQDTLNIEMVDNYNCPSCGHYQPESLASKALRVVASLSKSGWLRSFPYDPSILDSRIAELTRERDEALSALRPTSALVNTLTEQLRLARATQSSPEVLAVVEALMVYKREFPESFIPEEQADPWLGVVNALAAYQRKAEPKPQYRMSASSTCAIDRVTGPLVVPVVRFENTNPDERMAVLDALNAADAAGRKS